MIYKHLLITLFGLFVSATGFAQNNINGTWKGQFLTSATDLGQPRLVVEIYDFKDSIFTGITHLYYDGNKYEHYKMVGRYIKKDSLLVFMEASTIAVDLGIYGNCLGTYMMQLKKQDSMLLQTGYWVANRKGCSPTSQIWLQKKIDVIKKIPEPVKETAVVKKPVITKKPVASSPALKPQKTAREVVTAIPVEKTAPAIKIAPSIQPAIITLRATDVQSLLEIAPADKDSIRVDVYDNGEIDGDSVSVYEENIQRVNKKMITAKPITFYVSLNKNVNPIAHLRLVAESLGSIPPCTALMIVTTKSKRYEVHLSSNFSKNATVELFLKE